MERSPDISVVIPTYNRRDSLERAIASCFEGNEALDIEVVVVDDGSTDGTRAWLEALEDRRITSVRQENQGSPTARNRGAEIASGQYLKFLDDDDWLVSGALCHEADVLRESGRAVSVGNIQVQREGRSSSVLRTTPVPDLISGILRGDVTTHPHTFLYRRDVVEGISWDVSLRYHQDTDFAVRVASTGVSAVSVDEVVGVHNDHQDQRITTQVKHGTPHAEMIRRRVATIQMGVERLKQLGGLQAHHRRAAAEGIWRWAHVVSAFDLDCFRDCMRVLREIAPDFSPSRNARLPTLLDQVWGPSLTETVLFPLRWTKRQITSR